MDYVRKMYVEFLYVNQSSNWMLMVETRAVERLEIPLNAFGFRFFEVISAVVDVDGEKVDLVSSQIKVSPTYYYGGKLYLADQFEQVKAEFPEAAIFITNMITDHCEKVIRCRTGNWEQFKDKDIFIDLP